MTYGYRPARKLEPICLPISASRRAVISHIWAVEEAFVHQYQAQVGQIVSGFTSSFSAQLLRATMRERADDGIQNLIFQSLYLLHLARLLTRIGAAL